MFLLLLVSREFFGPDFGTVLSQESGEKGGILTDHVKCGYPGWVHILPYSW